LTGCPLTRRCHGWKIASGEIGPHGGSVAMVMGDPGVAAVRRSANYPSVLWAGRIGLLALITFLTAVFFLNTWVAVGIAFLAFLFFIVSYVAFMLGISRLCAEHPGSVERFVRASAIAGIQMDLFRSKPTTTRR